MSTGNRTLPIRRWLALALAVTFLVPALSTVAIVAHQFGETWRSGDEAAQIIRAGVPQWNNSRWQTETRDRLARQGIDFVLVENGRELYRSTLDPLAETDAHQQRAVQRIVISSRPLRTAYIYSGAVGWAGARGDYWLVPVVGLTMLLATLAAIAWLLGRTVVAPLAATSDAARQVASGDLNVNLPSSRIREVAELNSAFAAMSAELRASLRQQAGLEEERRLFISAIAHDLRTPLFSLRGYLEGLEEGLARTPAKRAEYIRVCREKADVLERLVDDLFAYTRVEYLEQTLRRDLFNVGALLHRTVEGRRREADLKGVTLVLDGPEEDCVLAGDEHLVGRAVDNLLDNALRYTSPEGRIDVRWHTDSERAEFIIADSGPGIADQDLPHLFEPMYRGDRSRNRETGGAGLGLAIARRIIRAHGGDLSASNRPTGGSEFSGFIPLPRRVVKQTAASTDQSERTPISSVT